MSSSHLDEINTRSDFPALSQDQVFFDNAGGSQTLRSVIDGIAHYLANNNDQLGASYDASRAATARYRGRSSSGPRPPSCSGTSPSRSSSSLATRFSFQPSTTSPT
jgi:hypothetical protein